MQEAHQLDPTPAVSQGNKAASRVGRQRSTPLAAPLPPADVGGGEKLEALLASEHKTRETLTDLKRSVDTFEAFFAIGLMRKLDEMIDTKLAAVSAAQRQMRLRSRLLALSMVLNVACLAAIAAGVAIQEVDAMARQAAQWGLSSIHDAWNFVYSYAATAN